MTGFLISIAHFQFIQIIVLGGFGLGVFYFTAYNDGAVLRQSIVDVKNQVRQKEGEVADVRMEINKVKQFEQEVSQHKKVIKFYLNYIPETLTFTEVSSLVNEQALSSGVNIESKEDSNQTQNQEGNTDYDILNMKLKVSGSFPQIMFFLSKLTYQKRLLFVNKIDLNIMPESRQIMSDINLQAYRYKADIDPPADEGEKEL